MCVCIFFINYRKSYGVSQLKIIIFSQRHVLKYEDLIKGIYIYIYIFAMPK